MDVETINLITTIHSALGNPPQQNSLSPNKAAEEFLPHLRAQEKVWCKPGWGKNS
jgi:hypothetical protein